jgi:eukaryotic-like serine/threonine-protein kinase
VLGKLLLVAKCWKKADLETEQRMCEAMNRQNEAYLQLNHIQEFPCVDLHTIDAL